MGKHINTLKRIERVAEITEKHYEIGRLDRCYKEVWRRYVNPVYPMSYRTYLRYVQTNYKKEIREQEDSQGMAVPPTQFTLF